MKRVLIIGPRYFHFLPATASAFRAEGWEPFVEGYDNPVHPYTGWMRVRWRVSRNRAALQAVSRTRYQTYILRRFAACRPDLVFILNGDLLETATLDAFRRTAKVALWLFDSLSKLPASAGHADHVDALFCFDRDDVTAYRAQGKQAFFLPQACDTDTFRPMPSARKEIDLLFVGNLYYSPRRKQLMNAVIAHFPERRIEVYGWYQPWFKGIVPWLKRPYKRIYKNRNLSGAQTNALYNRAKVVLNIHQEHQRDGANPRVFEICGAGAYQVCDRNPYIASLFPEGTVGLYDSEAELIERISMALDGDTARPAAEACACVRQQHSFRCRIAEMLTVVYPGGPVSDGSSLSIRPD